MNQTPNSITRPRPLRTRALASLTAILGAIGIAAFAPSPALAAAEVDGKFAVSGVGPNNELTKGPDGSVWVTLDQGNDVARIKPNGQVTEYDAANISNPIGITSDADGNLWVTQPGGVASFAPQDPEAAVKHTVNAISDPRPIVLGPDENLWTVSGDKAIRIPTANPAGAAAFPVLVAGRDIDAGKDGRLWAADFDGQVVRIETDGTAKAFDTGDGSGLQAIAAGPKGQAAYADPTSNPQKVGRIKGGKVKRKTAPGDPFGVAFAADGAYWIPRFASGDLLRLTPGGKTSTLEGVGKNAGPRRIATGPKKTLWVTLDNAEKIARVTGVR